MQTPPVQLKTGQVQVWLTRPDTDWTQQDLERFERCMNEEERARGSRYRMQRDARAHVVTRAMVRTLLSAYAGRSPGEWHFEQGAYGKPSVAAELNCPVRFNVSHARGRIACAFALDREVGIDVENAERTVEALRLSHRFFSPTEAATLAELPAEQRQRRFFTYWTLKEAFIKVIGMGLAMPLDQFSFELHDPGPPTISFAPGRPESPSLWRFEHGPLDPHHHLAVAVERDPGAPPAERWLEVREFRPRDWTL